MISSLRFEKSLEEVICGGGIPALSVAGFTHAILEYVFSLPREERGIVDNLFYGKLKTTEEGVLDRTAIITVAKGQDIHFFYVLAEASPEARQEWRVVGRSIVFDGFNRKNRNRLPDFDKEMIWVK